MAIAHSAKLVLINAPTRESKKSRAFYSALLGAEFAHGLNPSVPSWFTPLGHGVDFTITDRYDDRERLTPYFAVDDLAAAIKQLEELGGRRVVDPRDIVLGPEEARKFYIEHAQGEKLTLEQVRTVGRMAVMLDPDLNHVGLMQVAPHAQRHFQLGEYRDKADKHEQAEFAALRKEASKLEAAGALPT